MDHNERYLKSSISQFDKENKQFNLLFAYYFPFCESWLVLAKVKSHQVRFSSFCLLWWHCERGIIKKIYTGWLSMAICLFFITLVLIVYHLIVKNVNHNFVKSGN